MPSVILLDNGDKSVNISPHSKETAARLIADGFEGMSTDDETTRVDDGDVELPDGGSAAALTVVLINENADDGSGAGGSFEIETQGLI